jgi:DNA mismatch endonuclease, patch repair protein
MGREWQESPLANSAWRAAPGLTRADRAGEQDLAAGGRHMRVIGSDERPALASVYLRRTAGRRVYAYLRWADGGVTSEKFVCEVSGQTRAENLAFAWSFLQRQGLLAISMTSQKVPERQRSWASSETVRRQMQSNKSRDTRPELALRSQLHKLGLRYRVGLRPLKSSRRTVDLAFTRVRIAVFVDGCFWHGCPAHYRPATTHTEFWNAKVARNRERDRETTQLLEDSGWLVIRVWEHEDINGAAAQIKDAVRARGAALHPRNLRDSAAIGA